MCRIARDGGCASRPEQPSHGSGTRATGKAASPSSGDDASNALWRPVCDGHPGNSHHEPDPYPDRPRWDYSEKNAREGAGRGPSLGADRSGQAQRSTLAFWNEEALGKGPASLARSERPRRRKKHSELEDKLIRLIRSEKLPLPAKHHNAVDADRWLGEVDFAYPRQRIAIEVHGYRLHSSRTVWEDDQLRENGLVQAGWRVLKVTSSQLEDDPGRIIGALRSLLGKKSPGLTKKLSGS